LVALQLERVLKSKARIVQFAHFSVLEYLKSGRISQGLMSKYHISEVETQKVLAASCFAYLKQVGEVEKDVVFEMRALLNQDEYTTNHIRRKDLDKLRSRMSCYFPFLAYALRGNRRDSIPVAQLPF